VGLALMARSQIIQSFVARFWLEQTDDADPKWRGHIRHVQGCEETYFEHLEEMSDFMQQVSGIPGTEIPRLSTTPTRWSLSDDGQAVKSSRKKTMTESGSSIAGLTARHRSKR
jgi:hypothetical protein